MRSPWCAHSSSSTWPSAAAIAIRCASNVMASVTPVSGSSAGTSCGDVGNSGGSRLSWARACSPSAVDSSTADRSSTVPKIVGRQSRFSCACTVLASTPSPTLSTCSPSPRHGVPNLASTQRSAALTHLPFNQPIPALHRTSALSARRRPRRCVDGAPAAGGWPSNFHGPLGTLISSAPPCIMVSTMCRSVVSGSAKT